MNGKIDKTAREKFRALAKELKTSRVRGPIGTYPAGHWGGVKLKALIDSMEVIEDDCDCKKIIQLKNGDWVCQYCGYNFGKDAPTLQAEQEADDSAEL